MDAGSSTRAAAVREQRRAPMQRLGMLVVAGAVALFLLAWAGLHVQLASGRDPGLNDGAGAVVMQSADQAVTGDEAAAASGDDWATRRASPRRRTGSDDAGGFVTRQS